MMMQPARIIAVKIANTGTGDLPRQAAPGDAPGGGSSGWGVELRRSRSARASVAGESGSA